MAITLIRWEDHELVPWKNGLGMTREVANAQGADGVMLWRISLATVDRDGPFSDFSGYKRIIMMLSGDGMTLDFGSHGRAVMDKPFQPVIFDGAWPTSARLHGGATRDLNVVTAQESLRSQVAVLEVPQEPMAVTPGGHLTFLHVLAGTVSAGNGETDWEMACAETLRIEGEASALSLRAGQGEAKLYRIDIDLA